MSFFNVDLSKIEERLFAGIASNAPGERFPNKLWGFVSELPKKHPFRFAMLYSAGPATAERMTRAGTSQAERRVHLEAEIQCFENFARGDSPEESFLARFNRLCPSLKMQHEGSITGRWFNRERIPLHEYRPRQNINFAMPYGCSLKSLLEKYKDQIAANDGTPLFDHILGEQHEKQ
jgi:hypothetical protein